MTDEQLSQHALNSESAKAIEEILNSGNLYYSTTYDISHSLQHNFLLTQINKKTVIDDRYFFNKYLSEPLLKFSEASPWIVKTIFGYVGTTSVDSTFPVNGVQTTRTYDIVLISRINNRRLGTRYHRRGLDVEGNAANNVEMEQIVFNHEFMQHKNISSFVQMRGSVPSIWRQTMDLNWKPSISYSDISETQVWNSITNHLDDLVCYITYRI